MKYFLISVMEYRFGICFSPAPFENDFSKCDFEPILLFPSQKADFEIVLPRFKEGDTFYQCAVKTALGTFFFEVRGLPLEEIEICHSVSIFTLKKDEFHLMKTRKCEYKFTTGEAEVLGIGLEYKACDGKILIKCENLTSFDKTILPSLLIKADEAEAVIVYALCESSCELILYGEVDYISAALLIFSLLSLDGFYRESKSSDFILEDGQRVSVLQRNDSFLEVGIGSLYLGSFEY